MNLLERATAIGVEGFMHCDELEKLTDLACNKDVLEIGSFKGLSAWAMASVAKSIMCVDTWKSNSAGQIQTDSFTTRGDFKKATARFRNVNDFVGTSENAAISLSDGSYDLIFLDAMHTYEDVKEDIKRWYPRLRNGGTFVWHDYSHPHFEGVKQAVDEFLGRPVEGQVGTLAWVTKQ